MQKNYGKHVKTEQIFPSNFSCNMWQEAETATWEGMKIDKLTRLFFE